jgi:hypothetical protein
MRPLFDAVVLNMARAVDLYRLGGVLGLLLGATVSILISRARPWEASGATEGPAVTRSSRV